MSIKITTIDWDTDGHEVELPDELIVDIEAEGIVDPDNHLADWLSDKYGWTVKGLVYESVAEDEPSNSVPYR